MKKWELLLTIYSRLRGGCKMKELEYEALKSEIEKS